MTAITRREPGSDQDALLGGQDTRFRLSEPHARQRECKADIDSPKNLEAAEKRADVRVV
jgi:hypothetical protein